jgi:hypothetical protein
MSVTQIPPRDPVAPSQPQPIDSRDLSNARHWETAYRGFNPAAVPHLLLQLQDDLSRARKREAVWLSVVLHLLVVVLLVNTDKLVSLFPHRPLVLPATIDLNKQKDATYLELPPDEQKLTRRPDSKIIPKRSHRHEQPANQSSGLKSWRVRDLKTRSAAPSATNTAAPGCAEQRLRRKHRAEPQSRSVAPNQNPQTAQLQTPPRGGKPSFTTPSTAGSAIEQAARAAAANRGNYGGGESGDYGLNQGRGGAKALDQAEILTDTMGVDFGPYLARITQIVRSNWMVALPPVFTILKQGKLSLISSSQRRQSRGMTYHNIGRLDRAMGQHQRPIPSPPLPGIPGDLGLLLLLL